MAEKKCRHCGKMIPKEAKICPYCQKKQGWTWPAKIFLGLIILGVLGTIFGKNNQETTPPPKPAEQPIEIISISAEQLYQEYEENEIAADLKYKNKNVKVNGTIRVIGKTIGDTPYINLATGTFSHQVMVMFPADKYNEELASFKQGSKIEVTGKCTGKTLGMVGISLR